MIFTNDYQEWYFHSFEGIHSIDPFQRLQSSIYNRAQTMGSQAQLDIRMEVWDYKKNLSEMKTSYNSLMCR